MTKNQKILDMEKKADILYDLICNLRLVMENSTDEGLNELFSKVQSDIDYYQALRENFLTQTK